MGITPGWRSNQPWLDWLLAAHGPQAGVLASIQRLHGHTMLGLTPGMQPAGALPAWARGGRNRLAGVRVAAGRFWPGLARLVMSGKHWLRNVAAARDARRASCGRNTMATKKEAGEAVRAARARLGVTWAQLAEAVGRPAAWTTSALLGQQPMTAAQATAAGSLLELGEDVTQALQLQPTRGALDPAVPADPTIYRFYEVLQVYGPTIKELICEQFGDGIMSAINFRLDVRREPDPGGDRVIVTLDGKFLPYQW